MNNKKVILEELDRLIKDLEYDYDSVDDLFVLTVQVKLNRIVELQKINRDCGSLPVTFADV